MKNHMTSIRHFTLLTASALALGLFAAPQAQAFDDAQKAEIGEIIQNYLEDNPHVVSDALAQHQANQQRQEQEAAAAKLAEYQDYFASADLPMAGNPNGDITVVEFFDYNCGFCKRALTDIEDTLENDDQVRFVFMEMPILGPASRVMAEYSLASHKQGKYFEYHQKVMNFTGPKEAEQLEKLAEEVGLDIEQLRTDAKSQEIADEIAKHIEVARAIGIRGTPGFVIGNELHRGYLGPGGIANQLEKVRGAASE